MTTKPKRGRPRKQPILGAEALQRIPFEALPDGKRGTGDKVALERLYRSYLQNMPHINDSNGDLQNWLSAAADAIKAGDVIGAGYYAFHAMRARALLAYQEPLDIEAPTLPGAMSLANRAAYVRAKKVKGQTLTVHDLADVGASALKSDKKRGPKTHIVRR